MKKATFKKGEIKVEKVIKNQTVDLASNMYKFKGVDVNKKNPPRSTFVAEKTTVAKDKTIKNKKDTFFSLV